METVTFIIAAAFFLWLTIGPLFVTMHKKRLVQNTYDKSIIYLASEMSHTPDKWDDIKKEIDYDNPRKISIPFKTIWVGMYGQPLSSFGQVGTIWYGLLFLASFAMIGLSNTPLKLFAADFMNIMFILGLGLCWFFYYFRSFASDISQVSQKADTALGFLISLKWEEIDESLVDILEQEVKVDFDLYKKETGIGGIVLLLVSSSIIFYSKINGLLSLDAAILLAYIFASILISKWLYDSYRSRLIEIALNSVLALKKNIRLKKC